MKPKSYKIFRIQRLLCMKNNLHGPRIVMIRIEMKNSKSDLLKTPPQTHSIYAKQKSQQKDNKKSRTLSYSTYMLSRKDSNSYKQCQKLMCYHYTTGQSKSNRISYCDAKLGIFHDNANFPQHFSQKKDGT